MTISTSNISLNLTAPTPSVVDDAVISRPTAFTENQEPQVATKPEISAAHPQPRRKKKHWDASSTSRKKSDPKLDSTPLSDGEKAKLGELESKITLAETDNQSGEAQAGAAKLAIADALFEIQTARLYRIGYSSFEQYALEKFKYSRAHANRMAKLGSIRAQADVSPRGDILRLISSEKMARPLLSLGLESQQAALDTLQLWLKWKNSKALTPDLVSAAVLLSGEAKIGKPKLEKQAARNGVEASIEALAKYISAEAQEEGQIAINNLKLVLNELLGVKPSTKIQWTIHTWNPLSGCSIASAGCHNCYAANLLGTRMRNSKYADLVESYQATENGKPVTKYRFNGKIALLPERLVEPLQNKEPSQYFVNSMSDLFHSNVPDEFIESVFSVMEKADWHIFQVLTKRPERMAAFTAKYYGERPPAKNIWLGISTEDQKTFDKRLPCLLETKACVRWLSVEPLLGPIQMDSLEGVDWVVVGGESGPNARKMEKAWAAGIRDACLDQKVPFFFKQWGAYGEDGNKLKRTKGSEDPSLPRQTAVLDGVSHSEFPA